MKKINKIFVAGHNGMVGNSVYNFLKIKKFKLIAKSKKELNLLNQKKVFKFIKKEKPDIIINAAAKVGGIKHNSTYPANFIYENLTISSNLIHAAYKYNVKKFINLGSACVYPKFCKQPIKEEYLLTGSLEKTNEAYAIAKIASIKMCEFYNKQYGTKFISLQPTNLYGENDNYNLSASHVLPALIRKFHEAKIKNLKSVEIWGTGKPKREFMHVSDLSRAIYFVIKKNININIINVGSGDEISIKNLARKIAKIIGYKGSIKFNTKLPDGTPRRIVDNKILKKLGWRASIKLDDGIKKVYESYKSECVTNNLRNTQ